MWICVMIIHTVGAVRRNKIRAEEGTCSQEGKCLQGVSVDGEKEQAEKFGRKSKQRNFRGKNRNARAA